MVIREPVEGRDISADLLLPCNWHLLQTEPGVLPATLTLLQSALLQGGALNAVIELFIFLSKSHKDPKYAVVSHVIFLCGFFSHVRGSGSDNLRMRICLIEESESRGGGGLVYHLVCLRVDSTQVVCAA